MSIYYVSDLHFGHKRLLDVERIMFKSIEEHDEFIIAAINRVVKQTDTLYILGDIGTIEYIPRLNGRKYLIRGNHDKRGMNEYLGYFVEVYTTPIYIAENIVLSHAPIKVNDSVLNVHGHLHGSVLASNNHLNLSINEIDYKPMSLETLQFIASKLPKEQTTFLSEWYADLYKFTMEKPDVVTDSTGRILLKESKSLRNTLYNKTKAE